MGYKAYQAFKNDPEMAQRAQDRIEAEFPQYAKMWLTGYRDGERFGSQDVSENSILDELDTSTVQSYLDKGRQDVVKRDAEIKKIESDRDHFRSNPAKQKRTDAINALRDKQNLRKDGLSMAHHKLRKRGMKGLWTDPNLPYDDSDRDLKETAEKEYNVSAWRDSITDSPDVEEFSLGNRDEAKRLALELKDEGFKVVKIHPSGSSYKNGVLKKTGLSEAQTVGDITFDNGVITQGGKKIGTAMQGLQNGYHPSIELKLINGFNKWYEFDTDDLMGTIVNDIRNNLGGGTIKKKLAVAPAMKKPSGRPGIRPNIKRESQGISEGLDSETYYGIVRSIERYKEQNGGDAPSGEDLFDLADDYNTDVDTVLDIINGKIKSSAVARSTMNTMFGGDARGLTGKLGIREKQEAVSEADKHSLIGKMQRGHELKKKVDSTYKDIGIAQRAGNHPEASKAFRKHERYANLERPGTWTKVNEEDRGMLEETYHGDEFFESYGEMWFNEDEQLDEAEYQCRKVSLGKPMRCYLKKFKVYVKDPKTGNVKKVNFGDPNMKIRKSNPGARKSFRARHNCANPGPRTKARYWSCRKW
jgi:hypothetical protein